MLALTVALAAAWTPSTARADGDPASDVLVSQSVFLPADAGASAKEQAQLGGLLEEAQRDGFQIRVALIASASDLGSITPLWRQPQTYAQFLGEELSLVYRGTVLIVMPNGFGLYHAGSPTAAERAALAGVRAPGSTGGLVSGALAAVQRLAAASGHSLTLAGAPAPAAPAATSNSRATVSWLVFAIGGVLIGAAWIASLRARPLRAGDRTVSSS